MGYGQPSGKPGEWRARFLKPDGTYGSKSGFKSEDAAEKAANKIEAQIEAGSWVDPKLSRTRVADWYAKWRAAQSYRSIDTEATYDQAWRKHIEPRWGTTRLDQIMPIDVQAWEAELLERYAPSTVNVILTPLRQMLEAAHANRMISFLPLPPASRNGTRKKTSSASKGSVVPIETWDAICARLSPRDAMLARLVYWTGMRWSEACAVRARFLTLNAAADGMPASGTYYLHPDVGAGHEGPNGTFEYGQPKSGAGRTWDLPPFLVEELLDYVDWLKQEGAPIGRRRRYGEPVPAEHADLLFANADGWPLRSDTWRSSYWRPACDGRAGDARRGIEAWEPIWPGLRLHDGKHSHAAMLDDLGMHEVMRCDRLGHAIPGARGRYSQPTREMRARLLVALQERYESHLLNLADPANFSPSEASERLAV